MGCCVCLGESAGESCGIVDESGDVLTGELRDCGIVDGEGKEVGGGPFELDGFKEGEILVELVDKVGRASGGYVVDLEAKFVDVLGLLGDGSYDEVLIDDFFRVFFEGLGFLEDHNEGDDVEDEDEKNDEDEEVGYGFSDFVGIQKFLVAFFRVEYLFLIFAGDCFEKGQFRLSLAVRVFFLDFLFD